MAKETKSVTVSNKGWVLLLGGYSRAGSTRDARERRWGRGQEGDGGVAPENLPGWTRMDPRISRKVALNDMSLTLLQGSPFFMYINKG